LRFEDVHPKLGFTATDLNTAELVTLSMGDMNKAFKASVAVPGLFEPVVWGGKILVDGGLVNVVPTLPVKQMGADIVIGINLAATKFIYEKRMPIWRGFRFFTRLMGLQFVREKLLPILSPRLFFRIDTQSDVLAEEDIKVPGLMSILAKAIDHSFEVEEQWHDSHVACDLMLEPKVKHYGKAEFKNLRRIYLEGRRTAIQALPEIRKLIENWQPESISPELSHKLESKVE
jgi:NTE family protein